MSGVYMPARNDKHLLKHLVLDLNRQAKWADIVLYLETHCSDRLNKRRLASPATYAKHKRWLLNTERLSLVQVLVLQKMKGKKPMSQGDLIRLLGGNPNRANISQTEKFEITLLNRYWSNQIRNNIRPVMSEYFELISFKWSGTNKPGEGEYKIQAEDILIRFFKDVLYR